MTEEKAGETIVWRRLDIPGHEVATIVPAGGGWRVEGVAILVESGRPSRIEYEIRCDARWTTQRCVIGGHVAERPVSLDVARSTTGVWSIRGSFRRELEVDTFGYVIEYPGLWRAEATAPFPTEEARWR